MTQKQIEKVMNMQFQVWAGDKNALEALVDTCHALANELNLNAIGRAAFMHNCSLSLA